MSRSTFHDYDKSISVFPFYVKLLLRKPNYLLCVSTNSVKKYVLQYLHVIEQNFRLEPFGSSPLGAKV